ncbi:MAG: hypothetical protein ACLGHG_02565 [Gammaproteobacteria bacterium]
MRSRPQRALLAMAVASAFVFTTGFGFGKKDAPPPVFDPAAGAESQASVFVALNKPAEKGKMKDVGKVALTACSVMFAFKSNATASTSGGLFSEAGGVTRAEASVRVEYNLNGMDDAAMQQLTNEICAEAETRLASAGFDVMPVAELANNEHFKAMHANGKPSSHEYKMPGSTKYLVYAPQGQQLVDPRYATLGGAFAAAKGQTPEQHEGRLVHELGQKVTPVRLNLLVDFAEVQGDGHKALGGLASKDSAEVKADVRLSVSGELVLRPAGAYDCWKSLKGGRDCAINIHKDGPAFSTAVPVVSGDKFYREVVDQTTTGQKMASGVTKGLALAAAMSGVKGGRSSDITVYGVNVDPVQYGTEVKKYAFGFIDMAYARAKSAK